MRLLAVLLALGLAAAALAVAGCGDRPERTERHPLAAVPAHGLSSWENAGIPTGDLEAIRGGGPRHYRFNMITNFVDWNGLERTTRRYDRLVREAARRDIELLPVLMRLRTIKRPEPPRTAAERARWRALVRLYASRYGPDGAFWRENRDVPYRPIRAWEVWNEPNLRQFWDARPAPREYLRLLAETRGVLRAVDPEARVVSAGLAWRRGGARYLRSLLRHGGSCLFDAAGLHPYADSVPQSLAYVEEARAILDRLGARDAPLWITEIGWRVGPRGRYTVPTAAAHGQALRAFAAAVERRREELRIGPVFAFALRDRARPSALRRPVGHDYGLLARPGRPAPAWAAWSAVAGEGRPQRAPAQRECDDERRPQPAGGPEAGRSRSSTAIMR